MKLQNAKFTMLVNREFTEIEIEDSTSNTRIATIRLTPTQLSAALSRQAYVECECTITDSLDRVGKIHECKHFKFKIPDGLKSGHNLDGAKNPALNQIAVRELKKQNMSEWIPDNYYGSQGSFFSEKGEPYASVIIRRWV